MIEEFWNVRPGPRVTPGQLLDCQIFNRCLICCIHQKINLSGAREDKFFEQGDYTSPTPNRNKENEDMKITEAILILGILVVAYVGILWLMNKYKIEGTNQKTITALKIAAGIAIAASSSYAVYNNKTQINGIHNSAP